MAIANAHGPAGHSAAITGTMLDTLLPHSSDVRTNALRYALIIAVGSLLLTASAKLSIPFFPVPMTLQTLVVLCLGMVLGPKLGAATVLAYLAQGAAGLPVFAGTPEKGLGLAYMLGTTGGVPGWICYCGICYRLSGTAASLGPFGADDYCGHGDR